MEANLVERALDDGSTVFDMGLDGEINFNSEKDCTEFIGELRKLLKKHTCNKLNLKEYYPEYL